MIFRILNTWGEEEPNSKNEVCLVWDEWNDYSFYTLFGIFYVDENSKKHDLGGVKIAFLGQQELDRVFEVGYTFEYIGDNYFSLGISEEYYEGLSKLPSHIREFILNRLNDIAKKPEIYNLVKNEDVVTTSFFRSLSPTTVTSQFRRMANGGAKLTPYSFIFNRRNKDYSRTLSLSFDVVPESLPPTNIHVLIGRNGAGKTNLINSMIDSLMVPNDLHPSMESFTFNKASQYDEVNSFANLISVSFSAFDEVELRSEDIAFIDGIKYSYIGLRSQKSDGDSGFEIKDATILPNEFYESLMICKSRSLIDRLSEALLTLESDPNFRREAFVELIRLDDSRKSKAAILIAFRRLSSGHKIILLTITKLIEKLQEKSLVLMDEPEAHLHPPLLSAFVRTVSDLLIKTNGVAIIATHSPVILQEVPKSCVWKLRRSGNLLVSDRLTRESFGENVGILTNDIFGLEVTDSGFYKMLTENVENNNFDYESVMKSFNNQLGSEARYIIMALIANSKKS
ncbi:AAA family ATPase [Flavobacterium yafengii]|uniref:AAA family ATPase n=1 Tax=Flavobacterium yafengii TaxID=3041253 RepID=UPI0024A91216|nr:AAA family ATPase [Flavobacterium yafengii]MDI5888428.1 AAA family ATPase [Flavobacterium yafengii]